MFACVMVRYDFSSPYIDRRHIQAPDDQYVVMFATINIANDRNDTKDDHRGDNNVCRAHRLVAFHNLHKYNNRHENLCPLKRHVLFHRYLRQELYL